MHLLTRHGSMTGSLMGIPPPGRTATWHEVHIVRLAGGQAVEGWAIVDRPAMLRSTLASVPAPSVGIGGVADRSGRDG